MKKRLLAGILSGIMILSQTAPMYAQGLDIPVTMESAEAQNVIDQVLPEEAPVILAEEAPQEETADVYEGEYSAESGEISAEDLTEAVPAEEMIEADEATAELLPEDTLTEEVPAVSDALPSDAEGMTGLPEEAEASEEIFEDLLPEEETDLAAVGEDEGWIERQFGFGDRHMLRGWWDHIDRRYNCYVENSKYPDGIDLPLVITAVAVEDEEGSDVCFIEHEDENGWQIRAKNHGTAKVTVTYTDWDGTEGKTEEYRIYIGLDVYDVWMDPENGSYNILPDSSLSINAGVSHQIEDPETREQRYCTEEEMAGITYTWVIPDEFIDPEWKDLITVKGDGPAAVLTVKNPPEGWDPNADRGVGVLLVIHDNGEQVAQTLRFFNVSQHYAEIWPTNLPQDLKPGASMQIAPEVRFYDYGDDEEYRTGEISHYRWYYDDNCIEILDEKGKVVGNDYDDEYRDSDASWGNGRKFTIRRLGSWDTNIHLEVDGDDWGTIGRGYWLSNQDMWFDFDLWNGDQVYSNGRRDFYINLDNYQDMDYKLIAEAGIWEDDDFVQTFQEGDGWSLDRQNGILTLFGGMLYNEMGVDRIEVRLRTMVGDVQLFETQHGFPVCEAHYNFDEANENLFPGDERNISREFDMWVEDNLFPGRWVHAEIKSLTCTSDDDPYDDRDVVTVEENEDGWHFTAVRYGEARITAQVELYDDQGQGEVRELQCRYWVGDYRAYIDIRSESGSFNVKRGNGINLLASVDAERQEPNGDRHPVDTSSYRLEYNARVDWVDDNWWRDHDEDWETTTEKGRYWDYEVLDNNRVRIIAKPDGPDMDIRVSVRAFDHDEDGHEWEVRCEERTVFINNALCQIELQDEWDEDMPRGGVQSLNPVLMVYDDDHPDGVPYDNAEVMWRFEWYDGDGDPHGDDIPHVVITDADGKVLTRKGDGGDYGKAPFEIQRICDWNTNPTIIAMVDEGDGEFEIARKDLRLNTMDNDISFIVPNDRGGDWETWFYPTELVSVAPDRAVLDEYIAEGYPVEITLEYGSGYDDEDNLEPILIYEPDEDGYRGDPLGEFRFNASEFSETTGLTINSEERFHEIQELLRYQHHDYGHSGADMVIVFKASINGFNLVERDIWVRFWDEYRRMEDDEGTTIPGRSFYYRDGHASLYVEDPEHSGGNDQDDSPGQYYDVTITNIHSSDTEVLKPRQENGTWYIDGIRPGEAEITYTFTGGPLGDELDEHTTTLYCNDVVYWYENRDKNDEQNDYYNVLLNEEVQFRPIIFRQEYIGQDEEPELYTLDPDKCPIEYNEWDERIAKDEVNPYFVEIRYEYDDHILEYDREKDKFIGIHTGETSIRTEVWVYQYPEREGEDPEEVWYFDRQVHVNVTTARAELVIPEGAELEVRTGQAYTAMTIVRSLGGELVVYSLKHPEGESVEISDAWLGYVNEPLKIVEDQRVLLIPLDTLDDEDELEEDGSRRFHLWFTACTNGGRFASGADADVVVRERKLFDDVTDPTAQYFEPIYWAAENGITTGYPDNTFRPMNEVHRAAVVTFLWRIAGKPEPTKMATFKDLTKNPEFDKAISWAAEQGITTGWADNTFRPYQSCNRAAIVTFLWRYAGKPSATKMATFKDMTNNSDFDKAISWAAENNITKGWADNTFRPYDTCKRHAVMTFLFRFVNL